MPATFNVGPLAYPPTPTATCGLNSFRIRRAFHWLRNNLIITAKFFHKRLRSKPATGRPIILYPASGTRCISIRPSAPTKRISASGRSSLMALAIDTAGNICPPVPPPLIMMRGPLFFVSIYLIFIQIQHHCSIPLPSVQLLFVHRYLSLRQVLLLAWVSKHRVLSALPVWRYSGSHSVSCRYKHS